MQIRWQLLSGLVLIIVATQTFSQDPRAKQSIIRISKETTHITEPLDRKGFVDYVEAANQRQKQGVTPETNYEVVARRVLGPILAGEGDEDLAADYYRQLGIPMPRVGGDYYISYFDYRNLNRLSEEDRQAIYDEHGQAFGHPWTEREFPRLARWLQSVNPHLDKIVEGSKHPHNYIPYPAGSHSSDAYPQMLLILHESVQQYREVVRSLLIRVNYRIKQGNLEDAWSDLQAIRRLARHAAGGGTLMEYLVGVAMEAMAILGEKNLLNAPELTARQTRQFLAELQKLPPLPSVIQKLTLAERWVALDSVQWLARRTTESNKTDLRKLTKALSVLSELSDLTEPNLRNPGVAFVNQNNNEDDLSNPILVDIDWNSALQAMNGWFDLLVLASNEQDPLKRRTSLETIQRNLNSLKPSVMIEKLLQSAKDQDRVVLGRNLGNLLAAMLMPALLQAKLVEDGGEARQIVITVGFAMKLFHLEQGRFPKRLDELAPRYLATLPADPMTGKPLHYRLTENEAIVYSVGRNLQDDNGLGYEDRNLNETADDYNVRLKHRG